MPRTGSQLHRTRNPSHAGTSRSKNLAAQIPSSKINIETVRHRLTKTLLRWCLYDGQCRPFLWLRDGTHPLAVRPGNPGLLPKPGRPDRQREWVPTTGARPADRLAGQPRMASAESEVRPGPRPPTLRAYRRKTSEAVPGAPTHILPADSARLMAAPAARVPARRSSVLDGHEASVASWSASPLLAITGASTGTRRCILACAWCPNHGPARDEQARAEYDELPGLSGSLAGLTLKLAIDDHSMPGRKPAECDPALT